MREHLAKMFGWQSIEKEKEIQIVTIEEIRISSFQPRKQFHQEKLKKLAESISEVGVIQPIIVRRTPEGLELVAGERRLRASRIAGKQEIPAIIREISDREAAEIALIENLQREDLDYFEEAEGYMKLIAEFSFTQEELASRIGKSQAGVANKLRLLKLPPSVKEKIDCNRISERHARVLLKIPDEKLQLQALKTIYRENLTVQQTESLVEELIKNISREIFSFPQKKRVRVIKDLRIFLNSIKTAIDGLKETGVKAVMKEKDEEDKIIITLTIPKRKG